LGDTYDKAFMHGPTYMGNPIAVASANASLDLFEKEPRLKQVQHIEDKLNELLTPCRALPIVREVRVKGAIGVVQLNIDSKSEEEDTPLFLRLRKQFLEAEVHIRPFGDVIYLAPPFMVTDAELKILADSIYNALKHLS
jgi:adenosylmethionine-8-amino-7-oxononanoate aminotransferase